MPHPTVPPISQAANIGLIPPGSTAAYYRCWDGEGTSSIPKEPSTTCGWGDKSATRWIFLFGDSQAVDWLNAFNIIGKRLHWKVVVLAKDACNAWDSPNPYYQPGVPYPNCTTWRTSVYAFARASHPTVILPVGFAGDFASAPTTSMLSAAISGTVQKVKTPHAKVVLRSMVPLYGADQKEGTPLSCLLSYPSDVQRCFKNAKSSVIDATAPLLKKIAAIDHLKICQHGPTILRQKVCHAPLNPPGLRWSKRRTHELDLP